MYVSAGRKVSARNRPTTPTTKPLVPILKTTTYILILTTFLSCSDRKTAVWQDQYLNQEKSRIYITEKSYEYNSGKYNLETTDKSFETFNEKGQKIGLSNTHFYKYDSVGKIIEEEYCMRTCENPGKTKYYYDKDGKLLKIVNIWAIDNSERIQQLNVYNDKNQIVKKVFGGDSLATTEIYTYDNFSNLTRKDRKEYNFNSDVWLEYTDTLFYDTDKNLMQKETRQKNVDLLTISKYTYNDKRLLVSERDTTITTIKGYLLDPKDKTVLSAYYGRTDYKYNSENKLVEKILFQPDYQTPYLRMTYEFK